MFQLSLKLESLSKMICRKFVSFSSFFIMVAMDAVGVDDT